ncbi:Crp/Fnr family transcriptional regulator [Cetobacterium sp.]
MLDFKELVKFKFFYGIDEKELEKMFQKLKYELKEFKKNDIVFFRDEKIDGLITVIKGLLSAEMLKDNGDVHKIENLSEGDIIGSAFIFGENNNLPVDLIALEDGQFLHIDKKNLLYAFNSNEKFLVNFLNEISDKTQFLSNKVWKSFNNKTIKEKVADYIFENTRDDKVVFKHSIRELAEIFGVSRPSLSRVIGELVENKVLKRDGRNKFVVNMNKKIK